MFDCIIIGGGLNGLVSAIACKRAGLNVLLLEKGKLEGLAEDDPRTSAISSSTSKILDILGIWNEIQHYVCNINYIYTFEEASQPVLEFEREKMGFVIPNKDLKSSLIHIVRSSNIEVVEGITVESVNSFESYGEVNGKYKAKLIIIADGKNSDTAEKLHIKRSVMPYHHKAFVFNILHTDDHKNIAVECFERNGVLAVLPLSHKKSGIVWSLKSHIHEALAHDNILFNEYFAESMSRIRHIGTFTLENRVISYPLSLSFLRRQYSGRAFIIGDAFNAIHPVAGQGFNMSIKDIFSLYKYLLKYKDLGIDPGLEAHLSTLAHQNLPHHLMTNIATDASLRIFEPQWNVARLARSFGLSVFDSIRPLKNLAMKISGGN